MSIEKVQRTELEEITISQAVHEVANFILQKTVQTTGAFVNIFKSST